MMSSMTLTSATSPALLRRINLVRVLQELRRSGPLSRADVARATGLSRPTVSAVVADLEYAGYVRASGSSGDGLMGRPGQRYEFRADRAYVVGVDIGAHK